MLSRAAVENSLQGVLHHWHQTCEPSNDEILRRISCHPLMRLTSNESPASLAYTGSCSSRHLKVTVHANVVTASLLYCICCACQHPPGSKMFFGPLRCCSAWSCFCSVPLLHYVTLHYITIKSEKCLALRSSMGKRRKIDEFSLERSERA